MKRRTLLKAAAAGLALPLLPRAGAEVAAEVAWRVESFPLDATGARSMPAAPNKHSRGCYSVLTRRHYFLGGDMRNPWAIDSGVNSLWSYDALAQREGRQAWRLEYPYWGPAGDVQPCHPDEVTLVEDVKRKHLLLAGGYMFKEDLWDTPWKPGAAKPVRQRLMSFDHTGTRKWEVLDGDFFGGQSGSRGVLDPVDDCVYYAYYDGDTAALRVLNLSSSRMERRSSMGDARSKPAARWRQGAIDPDRRLMWFLDCGGKKQPARIFEVDLRSFKNRLLATLPWRVYSAIDMPYIPQSRELFLWGLHGASPGSVLVSTETGALTPGPPQPRSAQGQSFYLNYSSYDPAQAAILSFGTVDRPGAPEAIFHYRRNNKPVAQALFLSTHAQSKSTPDFIPDPGEVKSIALNTIRAVGACPSKNCVYLAYGGLTGMLNAWTSGILAESWGPYGALVVHGGGDGDYFGTEAYAFPFHTRKWERVGEPTTAMNGKGHKEDPGFDRVECEHADGTPGTPHTHDTLHWLPPSYMGNERGGLLRVCSTIVYTTCDTFRSHVLDLDTGKWSRFSLNHAKRHSSGKVQASVFDSKRNLIWRAPSPPRPTGVSHLNLRSREHTNLKIRAPKDTPYMGTSAYLEKTDTWAMLGTKRPGGDAVLALLDLSNPREWRTGDLSGDEIPKKLTYGCGFEFCPDLQCIFAYMPKSRREHQQFVWRIEVPDNPFEGQWVVKKLRMKGEELPDFRPVGTFKRWRWVPALKCFCYVGSVRGQTYLYRPEGV